VVCSHVFGERKQCVKQTSGSLAAQPNFFFGHLLLSRILSDQKIVAISFPNRIDVWDRLFTHFETVKVMTFASVT
jgi:hypothetical protein